MGKRIVVTGGSGKAGRLIIQYLLDQGHEILNLDLNPLQGELSQRVHTLRVDLSDTGQVYSALLSHFRLSEPFEEPTQLVPDAVIHLAGFARNMIVPDNETFRGNTLSTYNILESACRLGIRKVILASSVCVYGVTYAEGDVNFTSFPVDEDTEPKPMDVYSLSKVCAEQAAQSFARRFGIDAYVLRIGAVIAPDEYNAAFDRYVHEPSRWKVHGWSYTDGRDLGQMCHRAVEKNGLGFQIFNATNDCITNTHLTTTFLREQCPQTPHTRTLGEREAPMSNAKMKRLLGFEEEHPWTAHYTAAPR
ncbi:hypothetical protein F5X68DRAFT_145744 [Plectosphaerella plurivora]|uniref:NAD-dependent epimerase/dehydratase domain-containing protein n=1 Tax=Plectosphaerella plurivora TaxID=936078 RepID=A0A9P8UVL6_9PEZI|nr:hypothetical protein F5X68DRAFT_145744 [Plectosphaerella plurivora]